LKFILIPPFISLIRKVKLKNRKILAFAFKKGPNRGPNGGSITKLEHKAGIYIK